MVKPQTIQQCAAGQKEHILYFTRSQSVTQKTLRLVNYEKYKTYKTDISNTYMLCDNTFNNNS